MPWPLLALAWVVWALPAARPCDPGRPAVARQALPATPPGTATVDVSADGRFAAFVSLARLDPADDNTVDDIYVLDRATGRITLASVTAAGRASNGSSEHPRLSGDGRYVVFATVAPNLVGSNGSESWPQVLRRDRVTGAIVLVSHGAGNRPANGWSGDPDISEDGRYVVFDSRATDLEPPDANGSGTDIYRFDATDGSVRRISLATDGRQPATGHSLSPAISGDGGRVAFASTAPLDLEPAGRTRGGTPPMRAVFLRDIAAGVTRRVSTAKKGQAMNGPSYFPAISADGRRVAFVSTATNLAGEARAARQENLYVLDVDDGALRLVSRSATGGPPDGFCRHPALSGDGRYVVFSSNASNLQCAGDCVDRPGLDLNLISDVYRIDTVTGAAARVSGRDPREPWWNASTGAAIDDSGRVVAFSSRQPVDESDLDHDDDLYLEVLPATGDDDDQGRPCAGDPPGSPLR
jgi:Tol biopolymer transport system component